MSKEFTITPGRTICIAGDRTVAAWSIAEPGKVDCFKPKDVQYITSSSGTTVPVSSLSYSSRDFKLFNRTPLDMIYSPSAPKVSYDSLGSQAFYDNQTYS